MAEGPDEGFLLAGALAMDEFRHHALAGTGFPGDQHRAARPGDGLGYRQHPAHRRTFRDAPVQHGVQIGCGVPQPVLFMPLHFRQDGQRIIDALLFTRIGKDVGDVPLGVEKGRARRRQFQPGRRAHDPRHLLELDHRPVQGRGGIDPVIQTFPDRDRSRRDARLEHRDFMDVTPAPHFAFHGAPVFFSHQEPARGMPGRAGGLPPRRSAQPCATLDAASKIRPVDFFLQGGSIFPAGAARQGRRSLVDFFHSNACHGIRLNPIAVMRIAITPSRTRQDKGCANSGRSSAAP